MHFRHHSRKSFERLLTLFGFHCCPVPILVTRLRFVLPCLLHKNYIDMRTCCAGSAKPQDATDFYKHMVIVGVSPYFHCWYTSILNDMLLIKILLFLVLQPTFCSTRDVNLHALNLNIVRSYQVYSSKINQRL